MKKETALRLRRIYDILLSASIFAAGMCFIVGCVYIYRSGDSPYSREIVASVFGKIAPPVYACLALVLGGFVWDFFDPAVKKKYSEKAYGLILRRLIEKKDLSAADAGVRALIDAERKKRRTHAVIRTVLLAVGCIVFLFYALNPANFDRSDINTSMIRAMLVLLPCLTVPFTYAVIAAYHARRSVDREIALLRGIKEEKETLAANKTENRSPIAQNVFRAVIFIVAAAFIVYGFIAGGTADVLTKAINICTECIGLG